jgi:hypothetical protein
MRRSRRIPTAAALALLGALIIGAMPSLALSSRPMNLSDLVRESSQIVVGTVSKVNQGIGRNHLPYTEVELNVSQTLRGQTGTTLTFRQIGLQSALPAADGRRYVGLVAGMPQYQVGEHVVLFLGRDSSLGLRTTIGLGQGKFVLRGGNLFNEVNNAGLFQNLDVGKNHLGVQEKHMITTTEGAVSADTFVKFVQRAVDGQWWSGRGRVTPPPSKPRATAPTAVSLDGGPTHE